MPLAHTTSVKDNLTTTCCMLRMKLQKLIPYFGRRVIFGEKTRKLLTAFSSPAVTLLLISGVHADMAFCEVKLVIVRCG